MPPRHPPYFFLPHVKISVQWKNTGGLKQKHKKQPFGDATALAGEGGVGAVAWLIQASA